MDNDFLSIAFERSNKFHVIKYKTLIDKIIRWDKENSHEQTSQNILPFLSKLKFIELTSHGTDFFWSLVHRLSTAFETENKSETETIYSYFLVNAFDSFYSLLPTNSTIVVHLTSDKNIILPKLGISVVKGLDNVLTLQKRNNKIINYIQNIVDITCSCIYEISLDDIPSWYKLKQEFVCDRISILYQKHENLFENHYYNGCCENQFIGHLLKVKIESAFKIIKENNLDSYNKITSFLDYIIPFGVNTNSQYPNFAIATLKKTIFLSIDLLAHSDLHVAECIVHEYSHCELHRIQDTTLITRAENNSLKYYSPWRTDPRPLLGLIHAIYISREVIEFYTSFINNINNTPEEISSVKNKVNIIVHQILIAIKQIKEDELTEFSKFLVNEILNYIGDISRALNISYNDTPIEVITHKEIWKSTNSTYNIVL